MSQKSNSNSLVRFALAALALLSVGTGLAWWGYSNLQPPPNPLVLPDPRDSSGLRVYWLNGDGSSFSSERVDAPTSLTPQQSLEQGFLKLLQANPDKPSAIPAGTKLLALNVIPEGVVVDLSAEFTQGGGSASMIGRLGQVVYTASSLEATTPVWIKINGQPLETLGGEGLEVAQPLTRQSFATNFSITPAP